MQPPTADADRRQLIESPMKPLPAPIPEDVRELALNTMHQAKFPMLASMDGNQPRVRPVSPVKTTDFTAYIASFRSSHKTGEIAGEREGRALLHEREARPGADHRRRGEVIDREVIQGIWDANPLLRSYLVSIDNPEFVLYRVVPIRVRFMREWALEYHEVSV